MPAADSLRSHRAALRASAALGLACRRRDAGNAAGALQAARDGLALLASTGVRHWRGPAGAALVALTQLAEDVADQLGTQGASDEALAQALSVVTALEPPADFQQHADYFRWRLALRANAAPN